MLEFIALLPVITQFFLILLVVATRNAANMFPTAENLVEYRTL